MVIEAYGWQWKVVFKEIKRKIILEHGGKDKLNLEKGTKQN